MSFSFSFVANKKRKKRTKRKRKYATASYALTSVDKMDVASRACTLSLAIGTTHVNILSASISKIQNLFSLQKLASKSHSKFARTFAARMLFI